MITRASHRQQEAAVEGLRIAMHDFACDEAEQPNAGCHSRKGQQDRKFMASEPIEKPKNRSSLRCDHLRPPCAAQIAPPPKLRPDAQPAKRFSALPQAVRAAPEAIEP